MFPLIQRLLWEPEGAHRAERPVLQKRWTMPAIRLGNNSFPVDRVLFLFDSPLHYPVRTGHISTFLTSTSLVLFLPRGMVYTAVTSVLWRLKQKGHRFEVGLVYIVGPI